MGGTQTHANKLQITVLSLKSHTHTQLAGEINGANCKKKNASAVQYEIKWSR